MNILLQHMIKKFHVKLKNKPPCTTLLLYYYCNIANFLSSETVCYDDGCHLKKYATNTSRINLTPTAAHIASLNIVVDKMHFNGHTDSWCHENCNPYQLKELDEVNRKLIILYSTIQYVMHLDQHFFFCMEHGLA